VQLPLPHWLGTPAPPHDVPFGHGPFGPQSIDPPQPSPMSPQFAPCAAHVVFVHDGAPH